MSKILWVFVVALAVAPVVSAEIFKCSAKDGLPLYQNFPCQINSLGSLPSQPSGVTVSPAPADSTQVKPKNVALEKTALATPPLPSPAQPRVGMTPDEVRAIWGEPMETVQDEPVTGRVEIWQYGGGRIVQFNHRQRVLSVQR